MNISGLTLHVSPQAIHLIGGEEAVHELRTLYEKIDERTKPKQLKSLDTSVALCLNTIQAKGHSQEEKAELLKETIYEIIEYLHRVNRLHREAEQKCSEYTHLRATQNTTIETGTIDEMKAAYENKFLLNTVIGRTKYRMERLHFARTVADNYLVHLNGVKAGRL